MLFRHLLYLVILSIVLHSVHCDESELEAISKLQASQLGPKLVRDEIEEMDLANKQLELSQATIEELKQENEMLAKEMETMTEELQTLRRRFEAKPIQLC